jgi:hypothetical protein
MVEVSPLLLPTHTKLLSSPLLLNTCPQKHFSPHLFLNYILFSDWIAAHSSTAPISTMKSYSPPTYCLPYTRLPKIPNHYTLTLKMVTMIYAKTLDNIQHSMQLIPKNRCCTYFGMSEEVTLVRDSFQGHKFLRKQLLFSYQRNH